jgi:hypothetical protein
MEVPMQLSGLEIDPDTARVRLAEYAAALRVERNAEDEAIAAAYRAAARGLPVISLSAAVTAGGFFDNGLPRIAIARATATRCAVARSRSDAGLVYSDERATGWPVRALVGAAHVRVNVELSPPPGAFLWRATTVVPPVPPRHRPRRLDRLRACHILWEVEKWDPTPPRDPALLRHIRGDLWAVLAVWDLTDVERHVLAQRGTS